jgi:putative ABC transport system permease protein
MNLFHYAWREITGRPWRTFLNAMGVAIGVALVIVLFNITFAYQKAVTEPFSATDIDFTLNRPGTDNSTVTAAQGVILPSDNQAMSAEEVERINKLPEIQKTLAVLQLWSFDPGQFKVIMGLAPDATAMGPAKIRDWIKEGRFFTAEDKGVAVLESHFARFYGYKVGKPITISGKLFTIVGIYEVREGAQLTAANVYLPLNEAQALAGVDQNTINQVYLGLKDAGNWKQAIAAINQTVPGVEVTSADSTLATSDSILALLHKLAWPAAILLIVVNLLFVYRTLVASVWERIGEFGTMKAIGWRSRDIFHALTLELFFQVVLGALLGLAIGALGSYLSSRWQIQIPQVSEAPPLPGMATAPSSIRLPLVFPLDLYLACFTGAIGVGFMVTLVVAKRISALKPADAWRKL